MNLLILFSLTFLGLCLGSFAGATVWRLRAHQLGDDEKDGLTINKVEYKKIKKLTKSNALDDRSQCLNCEYVLRWCDLLPLISWLLLGGRCRKCRKPIGLMEPLTELGVAIFFVVSYLLWPSSLNQGIDLARFIIWLVAGVILAILFLYDLKWFLLPDKAGFILISLGALNSLIILASSNDLINTLINIVFSVIILSGLYLFLYIISKGAWIGFGDIKLGLGLALMLADWRLAFLALFTANLIGCIVVIPGLLTKKLKRDSHVPFGPLLIIGFIIAGLFGHSIVNAIFYSLA